MYSQEILDLAQKIATKFSACPQVVAITLAGSQTSRVADDVSDLDFYVYTHSEIPLDIRTNIAREFASQIEINNQFWEPGDEWIDNNSGCGKHTFTALLYLDESDNYEVIALSIRSAKVQLRSISSTGDRTW